MGSYNRVILVGNLVQDPELRTVGSGTSVCDCAIAINERSKKRGSEWEDRVTFVDITFWAKTAEALAEYAGKGTRILVEGRLQQDRWETNEGQTRTKLKVVCENMQLLSFKERTSEPETTGTF